MLKTIGRMFRNAATPETPSLDTTKIINELSQLRRACQTDHRQRQINRRGDIFDGCVCGYHAGSNAACEAFARIAEVIWAVPVECLPPEEREWVKVARKYLGR